MKKPKKHWKETIQEIEREGGADEGATWESLKAIPSLMVKWDWFVKRSENQQASEKASWRFGGSMSSREVGSNGNVGAMKLMRTTGGMVEWN
jgi:hypothetical protein